jgi:hypothetical protein
VTNGKTFSNIDTRQDRHLCAAAGISTNFFYTAAAFILLMESHAIFRATTTGIIGGKTRVRKIGVATDKFVVKNPLYVVDRINK